MHAISDNAVSQQELKRQVQDGQLSSITRKTIDKIEELLGIEWRKSGLRGLSL